MKNHLIKILLIELCLFIFAIFGILYNINTYLFLTICLLLSITLRFILKVDNRSQRFNNDYIFMIIIGILLYYIITYLIGFFVGFVYSTYSRTIIGITRNILTSAIFIFSIESMRERLILSGRYYKRVIVYSVILFTLFELVGTFNISIFSSKRLILEFFLSVVCPLIFKNILLTYLMYFSNKKNTILYQLIYILPTYILGIFPNLGDYVNSTLQTILPLTILFFLLKIRDVKREKIVDGRSFLKRKKMSYILLSICIVFTSLLIYLVSGLGQYYLMAIGSESMTGVINKGDTVFIDKKSKTHKLGQVIAFKMEGKIIVHRIIDVQITDKGTFYKTKGDFNNSEDGWLLPEANIVGNCILKIPLIGWPSVILSEFINR